MDPGWIHGDDNDNCFGEKLPRNHGGKVITSRTSRREVLSSWEKEN